MINDENYLLLVKASNIADSISRDLNTVMRMNTFHTDEWKKIVNKLFWLQKIIDKIVENESNEQLVDTVMLPKDE